MPIQPGTRLGPYEVVAQIGAGGMGEVWRGRDTRLDREVAIKILPDSFAASDEARARFEREAKVISSISHPHICVLYDVGHEGETHYLVMELLAGETLAERLMRGPLQPAEVLRYGAEVADALDRAHRQGVVHRDLKPGNVMLTKDGAKLLDFGLARPGSEAARPLDRLSEMATHAKALTAEGTIVGTFQYMAPEQLEGQEADARTDIFALGALLFEMATGRPAFSGRSKTSLIAAIVSHEPSPISSLAAMSPPALDHVVRNCLAKSPDERWQSAHDVGSQLRWIAGAGSQAGVAAAVVSTRRKRRNVLAVAAVLGWTSVAALAGWIALRDGGAREAPEPFRAELVPPPGVEVAPVVAGHGALSPPGRRLAVIGGEEDKVLLMVRSLATGEVLGLAGTEGATFPFWSPDARWLAFFADEKLKKIESGGGPVQIVTEAHAGRGGSWGAGGTIVFAADILGPLRRVSENGGSSEPVTEPASDEVTHRMPHLLPDGKRFLFVEKVSRSQAFGNIAAGSVECGPSRVVVERASNPQYAAGYLFFVRDRNLVAQRFDPEQLSAEGAHIPIADSIEYYNPRDIGNFSVSAAGWLVFRRSVLEKSRLAWFDRNGREVEAVGDPDFFLGGWASPDIPLVALIRSDAAGAASDIWVMDLGRGQLTRSTFISTSGAIEAVFSPSGDRLAVSSFVGAGLAGSALWIQPISGSGSKQTILESTSFLAEDWSRDGAFLIGTVQERETSHDIAYIRLGNEPPEIRKLVATRFQESDGCLSPDGKWLAYVSDETGRSEVYLSDFPAGARKWQISAAGGSGPVWSRDGRELYFATDKAYFAVSIAGSGSAEVGALRQILDRAPFAGRQIVAGAGLGGERILALAPAGVASPEPLRLIRNWRAELERRSR